MYGQEHLNEKEAFKLTHMWQFQAVLSFLVTTNVLVLALEADLSCWDGWWGATCPMEDRLPWFVLDNMFTLAFLVEWIAQVHVMGWRLYFRGDPVFNKAGVELVHLLDTAVILLRIVDVWCLYHVGITSGLKLLSAFRIAHLWHLVEDMQLTSGFRELWIILSEIGHTMKMLCCVAFMLTLVTWVGAVFITIAVGDQPDDPFDFARAQWSQNDYWGTVPKSMYSLFQIVTRDKWSSSLAWPLVTARPWLAFAFTIFLALTLIALMNTIVGAVVDKVFATAATNEERREKSKQALDLKVMQSLQYMFESADEDGNGEIDRDEMHKLVQRPRVKDRLVLLGIPYKDLELLFTLLDDKDAGVVKTDIFFRGCSRLRGPAMACDLHQMSVDLSRNINWANDHIAKAKGINDQLGGLLDLVDTVDIDIVRAESDIQDPVIMARRDRPREPRALVFHHGHEEDDKESRVSSKHSRRSGSHAHHGLLRAALQSGWVDNADKKDKHVQAWSQEHSHHGHGHGSPRPGGHGHGIRERYEVPKHSSQHQRQRMSYGFS